MSRTINTVHIARPLAVVFDYATTPKHWPQYHPNSLGVSGVTERPVQLGDVTRERASLMGREIEGDWKVVEHAPPQKVVWDIQSADGQSSMRLMYAFEEKDGGTQFTRDLEFHVAAIAGTPLEEVFANYMRGESEKAVQNLKKVMETQ
jgi:uncharacterized protein YndB with AHSA1/START domain